MTAKTRFELTIEQATGMSVETIREKPLDELRQMNERKFGFPTRIVSHSPFVGRGNVLEKNTVTHEEVEKELTKAIRP